MKQPPFSKDGNDWKKQTFYEGNIEANIWLYEFSGPEERKEIIRKLEISSQFNMKYKGLRQFYGDELIAYKEKVGSNKHANDFLRVISSHLTDNFEDNQLTSWKDCLPPFWEELIFTHFPNVMYISKQRKQSVIFLSQLNKFIKWLDYRVGTSWHQTIKQYTKEASEKLVYCEKLLNYLFLLEHPTIYKNDWNIEDELIRSKNKLDSLATFHGSIFQVKEVYDEYILITDINNLRDYEITGTLTEVINPGILLHGGIGKEDDNDFLWEWSLTEGVYPERAKKYINFI